MSESSLCQPEEQVSVVLGPPGFQNRRQESEYLKNVFPSGFHLKQSQHILSPTCVAIPSISLRIPQQLPSQSSFMSWTRGNSLENLSVFQPSDARDAYADVAGPYFRERLDSPNHFSSRGLPSTGSPTQELMTNTICLHERPTGKIIKVKNTKPKQRIYQAPCALPSLGSIASCYRPEDEQFLSYEDWLCDQRSAKQRQSVTQYQSNSSILTLNETERGMSTYGTAGGSSSHELLNFTPMPTKLPTHLCLEICSFKDIMGCVSAEALQHYRTEVVRADYSLAAVRSNLFPQLAAADHSSRIRNHSIKIAYFNMILMSWRGLLSEVDWNQAKTAALERGEHLKIMYSVDKQDEMTEAVRIKQPMGMGDRGGSDCLSGRGGRAHGDCFINNYSNTNPNSQYHTNQHTSNSTTRTATAAFNMRTQPTLSSYAMDMAVQTPLPISPRPEIKRFKPIQSLSSENMLSIAKQESLANALELRLIRTKW